MDDKERELKVQLLVSKLNSVISKRLERTKYAALNEIRVHGLKSHSIDRFERDLEFYNTNSTNATGTVKDKLLRFGTGSDVKKGYSPNKNYRKPHDVNMSESFARRQNTHKKSSLHPFSTSLMGDVLRKEQLSFKNNIGLAIALTPSELLDHSRAQTYQINETQDENDDSDQERQDLDDYITQRLNKIENSRRSHRAQKSKHQKHNYITPKRGVVIANDSQYEYILESEESEDEWNEADTPSNQIFSQSFLAEQQRAGRTDSDDYTIHINYNKNNDGSIMQMRARKSLVKGNVMVTEERKEDSYIHPALDNSQAFSNISAIMGQHAFNNPNMQSMQDDSLAYDCEELEFDYELDSL